MEFNSDKIFKIKKQVEYYMSDENLKNDRFFQKTIKDREDRMVPFEVLKNCKKIKILQITDDELVQAIENSDMLEVDKEKKLFGRINKFLPYLRVKKIYVTQNRNYQRNENEIKHGENFIVFNPIIFGIEADKKIYFKDKEMMRKLSKKIDIDVPYIKLSKKKGVIIFNENSKDIDKINLFGEQNQFELPRITFEMNKFTEEQVKNWLDVYRSSLELGLKQKYNAAIKKEQKDDKFFSKMIYDENYGPVKVLDKEFDTIRILKNHLKLIVQRTKNGSQLDEENQQFVEALLQYHPNKEKIENLDKILVDIHPEYKVSRCFIVQRKDGTKEDMSFHKCLNNLFLETKKNSKLNK